MLRQQTTTSWEHKLLTLAFEGLESHIPAEPVPAEAALLEMAYTHCEAITAGHSRTFFLASGLLPAAKRRAVRALYAFCRISDDLVDRATPDALGALMAWQELSLSAHPTGDNLAALAWADTRARYRIPRRYAEQLIEGVRRDLVQNRYASFEDLSAYCYSVASTVGLMAMHIIGFEGQQAIPYALKLGVALQMTNILRDVGEDWRAGRVYLPQQELAEFGLDEEDLADGRIDGRWQAFMRFQIDRNRRLYREAAPGIYLLEGDGRFAIAAAADLYQAILDDIEAHQYDVFTRRAHTSPWGKLRRLPGIWWRARGQGTRRARTFGY
jgi:phytoene synthase